MKELKTKSASLASVLAFIVVFTSCAQAQKDVSREIQAMNDRITAAIASGDQKAIMEFYTSGSTFMPPNGQSFVGVETISMVLSGMVAMGVESVEYTTVNANLHGKIVVEEGTYKLFASRRTLIDEGKYIVTWEKQGKNWVVIRDIWNSSLPLPSRAAPGDTICYISMKIKESDWEAFREFSDDWMEIARKEDPEASSRARCFVDIGPDKEGNITFHTMVEPFLHGKDNLQIEDMLRKKYSQAETDRIMEDFRKLILEHRVYYFTGLQ